MFGDGSDSWAIEFGKRFLSVLLNGFRVVNFWSPITRPFRTSNKMDGLFVETFLWGSSLWTQEGPCCLLCWQSHLLFPAGPQGYYCLQPSLLHSCPSIPNIPEDYNLTLETAYGPGCRVDGPSPISLPPLKGEVSATWRGWGCQAWDLIQAGVWHCAWSLVPSWLLSVSFSTENAVWVCT